MEVGAVKQAFNNELILLKKQLNQAKTQTIHKLTRKAKSLAESKAPEIKKQKLKRKAETAVREVMILKTIKAKDLGRFIVTHTGELQDYINQPQVNQNRACARLLLHKALQNKYKLIRSKFTDIPIKDLFMSRQERRKLKKEAREKQKKKNKDKLKDGKDKAVNAEGDWDVEDIETGPTSKKFDQDEGASTDEKDSNDETDDSDSDNDFEKDPDTDEESNMSDKPNKGLINDEKNDIDVETENDIESFVKISPVKKDNKSSLIQRMDIKAQSIERNGKKRQEKKQKDTKNKNLNEKLLLRNFKKDSNEEPVHENKVVDPFFITSTGENYMSVAEPRQPDEIKEIHKQGNRKLRRAAMFGHVPKIKPRPENFEVGHDRFNRPNSFRITSDNRFEKQINSGFGDQNGFEQNQKSNFENRNDRGRNFEGRSTNMYKSNLDETKPEKLHPSWEAKKRQSGILPFQGKKIVFDES